MGTHSFSALPPVRLPEQVYVPVATVDLDADETRFELRQTAAGELFAPVYSSLAAMIHCCGDYQPWLLLPAQRLVELLGEFGVDRIVLDLSLAQGQRHGPEGCDHERQ
ncbi:MAG: SAV_915 family protein [Pseudonocardiaceae bacterium]